MKTNSFILLFLLLLGCQSGEINYPCLPMYEMNQMDSLGCLAIRENDIEAFNTIIYDYRRLPYSIVMAHKNGYGRAYYYAYKDLVDLYKNNDLAIDDKTINMALSFLYEGADLEDEYCLFELSRLYCKGDFVETDSTKSKELFLKYFKKKNRGKIKDIKANKKDGVSFVTKCFECNHHMPGYYVEIKFEHRKQPFYVSIWSPQEYSIGDSITISYNDLDPQNCLPISYVQ